MREVIFLVEESDAGGYIAKALGESIIIEVEDTMETLNKAVRDTVNCHYDNESISTTIEQGVIR